MVFFIFGNKQEQRNPVTGAIMRPLFPPLPSLLPYGHLLVEPIRSLNVAPPRENQRPLKALFSDESGIAIIWVMFTMVVLSAIGISAMNLARLDSAIRQAENEHIRTFYLTEGTCIAAAVELENAPTTDINTDGDIAYFFTSDEENNSLTVRRGAGNQWVTFNGTTMEWNPLPGVPSALNSTNLDILLSEGSTPAGLRAAVQHPTQMAVEAGNSLVVTNPEGRKYGYYIYCLHDDDMPGTLLRSDTFIQIGYTKKF
jgi:Tfp pilus assembly protein PilX